MLLLQGQLASLLGRSPCQAEDVQKPRKPPGVALLRLLPPLPPLLRRPQPDKRALLASLPNQNNATLGSTSGGRQLVESGARLHGDGAVPQ